MYVTMINYLSESLFMLVQVCLFVLMHQCYYKYFVNLQNDRAKGECSFFFFIDTYTQTHTHIHTIRKRINFEKLFMYCLTIQT